MAFSTICLGRGRGLRRVTKFAVLLLLFIMLLTFLNDEVYVVAEDVDDEDDGDFDVDDVDGDTTGVSLPSQYVPHHSEPTSTPTGPSVQGPTLVPTATQPTITLSTTPSSILKPGTPSADCAIIADLYKATGPWQFVPDTVNCCNAEYPNSSGIKCNANNQIIYIYLAGQGLTGTLPESLGSLHALQYLLLYYNNLSGPIPSSLSKLPLLILDLSHNRLSGSLPSSATGWANLGTLNLEQNKLTGPVPDWVSTLPNLHSLAIGQNFFTTGDPPSKFSFNVEPSINGTITTVPLVNPADVKPPSSTFLESFAQLPKLKQLKLDSLGISGRIPASWQQKMTKLTKLDLSNNSMQGQIPGFINSFTGLKTLLLDRNEFGGPIPSFSSLKSLNVLDLSYNQLSGPLPPWVAGLNLTVLNLSNNLLSGPLPLDNHHTWRACSVANNYFVCTKGPEQVLSAKWRSDCKGQCTDAQQTVPIVRPPMNTTLPGIKVKQTHNDASIQFSSTSFLARWTPLAMSLCFLFKL